MRRQKDGVEVSLPEHLQNNEQDAQPAPDHSHAVNDNPRANENLPDQPASSDNTSVGSEVTDGEDG